MKEIQILIYRDWLEFKKKYLSFILLWSLLPMLFYLLLTSPLSDFISRISDMEITTIEILNGKKILDYGWPS